MQAVRLFTRTLIEFFPSPPPRFRGLPFRATVPPEARSSLSSSTRGKMKAGRKNLRRARDEGAAFTLAEGDSIMQVLTLRGSNVIEVMDGKGVKSLALFPAKFQKSIWIKKGSFVVVDASGREQALESGSKIACVVSQVLFHDQVRALEKSDDWPTIFKSTPSEGSNAGTQGESPQSKIDEEGNSDKDSDDDLPPLEANTNRNRPYELYSDSESGSDS